MQGRIAGIITFGFLSFLMIGAAGAASDTYFEAVSLEETYKVVCAGDPIETESARTGTPNCSVHRASSTYGRQLMAFNLDQNDGYED